MTVSRRLIGAERGPLLALAVLMLGTAFLAAMAPAMLTSGYDKAAQETFAQPTEAGPALDLQVAGTASPVRPSADLFTESGVNLQAAWWRDLLPPELRAVTGPARLKVATDRLRLTRAPAPGLLDLVWQPALAERIRYVAGTPPANGSSNDGPMEVAVAAQVAAELKLTAGTVVTLTAKETAEPPLRVRISGLFAPRTAAEPATPGLFATTPVDMDGQGTILPAGMAIVDPEGYAALYESRLPLHFSWRMSVHADRVTAASVPAMAKGLDAYRIAVSGRSDLFPCEVVTDLDSRLRRFTGQLHVAQAMLWMVLGGLAAVAAGVLLLAGRLLGERLRPGLETMRARGASLPQLAAVACGVPAVVVVPAVLGGLLVSRAAMPEAALTPSVLGVLLVLGWALLPPLVTVIRDHRGAPAPAERDDLSVSRSTPRRLAAEALVAALAVIGVVLARQRGSAGPGEPGPDPFIAAVPALVALAAGLVLLRCYPYPLRLVGRVLRRGRSGVGYVAIARAARQRLGALLPLVVLLLATAVVGFAVTVGAGLDRAQRHAALHQIGADALISRDSIDDEAVARLRAVRGVTALVPARMIQDAELTSAGGPGRARVNVVAVDLDAYRQIIDDLPAAPKDPSGALFSPEVSAGPGALTLTWRGGPPVTIRRTGTIRTFPTQDPGSRFVVIPYKLLPESAAYATSVFVRGDGLDPGVLRKAAAQSLPAWAVEAGMVTGTVETYQEAHRELTTSPLAKLVHRGFRYGLLVVAAYSALTVMLALLLSATGRGRTVSYLRTLGLSRRQAAGMAVLELAPMILTAAAGGWALGWLLPGLVGSAVDLRPYTGGFPAADHAVDPVFVPALAGSLILVAVVAAAVDGAVNARRSLGGVLRMGDQR